MKARDVLLVVGARPNFVKIGPLFHALTEIPGIQTRLLHTGQHYDRPLSDSFIEQLGLPEPDFQLGIGSGTHAEQTAAVMVGVERILFATSPAALVVAGDVNSTLGAALAAVKLGVPTVHLEAGLRSRDWAMPEEINRVLTDRMSDLLLCHCEEAVANLRAEGIPERSIALVGNTMIDSLARLLPAGRATGVVQRLDLTGKEFVLVTLHRPALIDDAACLRSTLKVLADFAQRIPVLFPAHPRTRARLVELKIALPAQFMVRDPLDYLEFIAVEEAARVVVTDSGGVQEETSALGVPCLTYRTTTERAVTVHIGTNRLVGTDPEALRAALDNELSVVRPAGPPPEVPLWDGRSGPRAAVEIARLIDPTFSAERTMHG